MKISRRAGAIRFALAGILALAVSTQAGCLSPSPASGPSATATPDPSASTTSPAQTSPPPTQTSAPPTTPPVTTPPTPPSSLFGQDFTRIPTSAKVVALTFDAGANGNGVPSILATLAAQGVTGTFFLTGDFVTQYPGLAQQIVAAGHRLGNHTVNHPHLPSLSDEQVRSEVLDAHESIVAVTGADPMPWFRFPYGDRDTRTIGLVNEAGYVPIRWTVDTLGWDGTHGGTRDASFVVDRVLDAATPGEIVLMHVGSNPNDNSTLDADALPGIISGLRDLGYSFVTLDAMLG